ncbi:MULTISPECIES: sialate O-acetylesterase [unclassified Leptolyngbya]|uniref:sialate O-acetylesterase n=1 Tax=unclassified Leptolyngbya TaxID=2650499 RepID=UPI0016867C84|nr:MULTISPECIES: sialate O-acetylesterase [unclassified Leptolyngbya]MBD1911431.1 hypothetical protein [Leptolyngbya sp. FACHB-8]MBD2153443.1 hypothetical protein [Leptolyngbya sp. FACHB-16]
MVLMLNSCNALVTNQLPNTLTLPSIINHHMVLQQQANVAVWGWDRPGTTVQVEFRDHQQSAQAGLDGQWMVQIPSGPAGGAFSLSVRGTQTIVLEDVWVGEVWVAGGQSNMWWAVQASWNAERTIPAATNSAIRIWDANTGDRALGWSSDTPQKTVPTEWKITTPESVGAFPATPYFFAQELYQALKVPIGIVHLAVPGQDIEAFLSREFMTAHVPPMVEAAGSKKEVRSSGLFNGMVYPAAPFTTRGFLWWQGEANADRALQYRVLFPGLIEEWRHLWHQEDAPFLFVELANFLQPQTFPVEDAPWPALRDAQKEALRLPNTAMVSTIDILLPGEDTTGHPSNKQLAGHRLYLAAIAQVYNQSDQEWSGPVFKSVEFRGKEVIATFDHVAERLVTQDGQPLRGFALAGTDQRFFWAKGRTVNNTVVLSSPSVEQPVAVRYGWANNPIGNLYNSAGLPAFPFRSDNWVLRVRKLQLQQMDWRTLATTIDRELIPQQSTLRDRWNLIYTTLAQRPQVVKPLIEQLLQQPMEEEILPNALLALLKKLES